MTHTQLVFKCITLEGKSQCVFLVKTITLSSKLGNTTQLSRKSATSPSAAHDTQWYCCLTAERPGFRQGPSVCRRSIFFRHWKNRKQCYVAEKCKVITVKCFFVTLLHSTLHMRIQFPQFLSQIHPSFMTPGLNKSRWWQTKSFTRGFKWGVGGRNKVVFILRFTVTDITRKTKKHLTPQHWYLLDLITNL